MTPARTASYGLGNPPPLYRWIDAVLMLFAELVHGAASTLKMIFNRKTRDWHTDDVEEALPHATSSIPLKETHQAEAIGLPTGNVPQPVFPAKAGIQTPHDVQISNRSKPERAHARNSLLSFQAKAQRAADPEPRSSTHRRLHTQPLASGSRASRASGMTLRARHGLT